MFVRIMRWYGIISAIILFAAVRYAIAETESPSLDFEMPAPHLEVHVFHRETVPKPDVLPEEARLRATPAEPDDPIEALRQDVETLRDELRLLQDTLNLMVNEIMADLREENEILRQEVRRLHNAQERPGVPDLSMVPRPGGALIDQVLAEPGFYAREDFEHYDVEAPPPAEPEPFSFTTVHEWGRTPEVAQELGDDAASLKGIVGVVPYGSRRADIERLGRDLREEYEGYDNINIEVFDDPVAAQRFVETQTDSPQHRVLSVSKHSASGRDVILYIERGEAVEVPHEQP